MVITFLLQFIASLVLFCMLKYYLRVMCSGTESLDSGGGSGSATPVRSSKEASPATEVAAAASKLKMPVSKQGASATAPPAKKRESLSQVTLHHM